MKSRKENETKSNKRITEFSRKKTVVIPVQAMDWESNCTDMEWDDFLLEPTRPAGEEQRESNKTEDGNGKEERGNRKTPGHGEGADEGADSRMADGTAGVGVTYLYLY